MSASLANGNRETGEEEGNGGGTFDTLESFVQDQVVKHEHALHELLGTEGEGGDGERSEDMLAKSVKVLAKKTMDLALAFREKEEQLQQARETLHIERTRRQTSAIQVEEREAQLTKAQDYSRKHEETFKKAARLQEEAQRRLETQYRESELRHERRHEQELKLRLDLEQRMDSLRDTEKQLRDRLAQERRAREAAEGAQRQMLQRHLALQLVKSPPTASASQEGTADSAGAEGPLSLGYTLDNVREITMMNHNLVSARETASIEKAKELAAQLKAKDHDLEKSKLSLKRVEHHNAKLIEENEEMMEALGLFNMESRPTTPGHGTPANGQGLGPSTVGALSVLASTETTLSTAVIQTIGASFVDFYRHLETLLNEVVVESAHADAGDRHVLVNKLVASSQETCKLCIESAVNRVLLEILEDDRPLIINGKAHSTYQLFEKVSKEMTRLRGELEEWKQKPQSQAHANSPIFLEFNEVIKELEECQRERETLRKDLDECQSEREILRTECHKLQGRLIVASTPSPSTDLRVGKLEQTIEKLREENKALLHHQASADEHKENLEKKPANVSPRKIPARRPVEPVLSPPVPEKVAQSPEVAYTPEPAPSLNLGSMGDSGSGKGWTAARSALGFSSSTKDALFRLSKMGKPSWSTGASPAAPVYGDSHSSEEAQMGGLGGKDWGMGPSGSSGTPKGYLPFVRHTDEALDYAIQKTAAGIHRRLSQARVRREDMINEQIYPNIVPPSPALSHLASSRELSSPYMASADQHISELAKLKQEVLKYKKEAIRVRSDLNEVVESTYSELMEAKGTPQNTRRERPRRGPRHQSN